MWEGEQGKMLSENRMDKSKWCVLIIWEIPAFIMVVYFPANCRFREKLDCGVLWNTRFK